MRTTYLLSFVLAALCQLAAALPRNMATRSWGLTTRPKWGLTTGLTWGTTTKPYWGPTTPIKWGTTVPLSNMVDVNIEKSEKELPPPIPPVSMYRNAVGLTSGACDLKQETNFSVGPWEAGWQEWSLSDQEIGTDAKYMADGWQTDKL
jgi:hypothetical protein